MTPRRYGVPSPEELEVVERHLRDLLGARDVDPVLDVRLKPEFLALVASITGPELPRLAAERFLDLTAPGGQLDPAILGIDVPWGVLFRTLQDDPKTGSNIARRWFIKMHHLAWNDETVHPISIAISGYFVGGFEVLRERPREARKWRRIADSHVEFEDPAGLSVLVWVRFCKLWLGVE